MRFYIVVVLTLILMGGFVSFGQAGVIKDDLRNVLQQAPSDTLISVLVTMSEQVDVEQLKADMDAANIRSRRDRHQIVIETAQALATTAQQHILIELNRMKENGDVLTYRSFWIANLIHVKAIPIAIETLARRSDVGFIYLNRKVELRQGIDDPPTRERSMLREPENGLVVIHAPEVWEMGYTGAGRLVCSFDSGVDGNHEAFADRWRGAQEGVEWWEAWFDPFSNSTFPYSYLSHGTHVMGIMVATPPDEDPLGVAYEAQWISGLLAGYSDPSWVDHVFAGYEWAVDPDGDPSTIEDVPDVINNSWGTSTQCDDTFWSAIDLVEAAGVVNIIAVANTGPSSGSVKSPESRADTPTVNFGVGNVNPHIASLPIASNSGRGPSPCDGVSIKPEVTAPGVSIRSTRPNNSYGTGSGASYAAPHVSGAVALLRQVDPDLTPDQIKEALMATAFDRGDTGEDNDYGWGVIDILAAVQYVQSTFAHVQGNVIDVETLEPVSNAEIHILENDQITYSQADGSYRVSLLEGDWTFVVSGYGYAEEETLFELEPQDLVEYDFELTPLDNGILQGTVINSDGNPVEDVEVTILETPLLPTTTDENGFYRFSTLPPGYYVIEFFHPDYATQEAIVEIIVNQTTTLNMTVGATVLVWEPDRNQGSREPIQHALTENDVSNAYVVNLTELSSIENYDAIFVCLGVYNDNYRVDDDSPEAAMLVNYINNGGNVYMEGGDCWYYDPRYGGYDFNPLFGISALSDGSSSDEIVTQLGINGTFTEGMVFEYQDGTSWIDHLTGTGTGFELFQNQSPPFHTMIGNDPSTYRTIGSSLEFAGYIDGDEFTKTVLMDSIINFFQLQRVTSVENGDVIVATPAAFELEQNVPNPFNPTTTISYRLPMETDVQLSIYDISGKLIRDWYFAKQSVGRYSVEWDGTDNDNQGIQSGMYIYRLRAGDHTATKTMVLLR